MILKKHINLGCHKIPDRCFSIKEKTMPFCARCLGCSIGHVISLVLFLFGKLPSFLIAFILIIPLGIDWSVQKFFGIMSNNNRRLITGILGGFGVGVIIWKVILLLIEYFI